VRCNFERSRESEKGSQFGNLRIWKLLNKCSALSFRPDSYRDIEKCGKGWNNKTIASVSTSSTWPHTV